MRLVVAYRLFSRSACGAPRLSTVFLDILTDMKILRSESSITGRLTKYLTLLKAVEFGSFFSSRTQENAGTFQLV
ncbi:hypothetical protein B0J17DRAFT_400623 [Rhizoctonia solani]|nr:hypothetical protein B0J17DRAFT_400623 [Rhizoctonia solani]